MPRQSQIFSRKCRGTLKLTWRQAMPEMRNRRPVSVSSPETAGLLHYILELFCNPLRLFQFNRQKLRYAVLPHRDAIELARGGHCGAIVRDDDELRFCRELAHHVRVALGIRFVERRVG